MVYRKAVESTSLKSVGYRETEQRLRVEFINDTVYDYFGVRPAVHDALMVADSKGSFFNTQVKERYRFERRGSFRAREHG